MQISTIAPPRPSLRRNFPHDLWYHYLVRRIALRHPSLRSLHMCKGSHDRYHRSHRCHRCGASICGASIPRGCFVAGLFVAICPAICDYHPHDLWPQYANIPTICGRYLRLSPPCRSICVISHDVLADRSIQALLTDAINYVKWKVDQLEVNPYGAD